MKLSELIKLRQNKKRLDRIRNNRKNIIPFVGAGIVSRLWLIYMAKAA